MPPLVLNPTELAARTKDFRTRDSLTWNARWWANAATDGITITAGQFTPSEDVFVYAIRMSHALSSGWDAACYHPVFASVQFASSAVGLSVVAATGSSLYENAATACIREFVNLTPYGFYVEKGRNVYVVVGIGSEFTGAAIQYIGSCTLYYQRTYGN